MAHDQGSFDYKVINENISKLLDARSELDNTIQISMPFIRATTTLDLSKVMSNNDGNIGFTLGLHAIDEDVRYEDMYASTDGEMPLIGYTYTTEGKSKRVYATDPTDQIISGLFDTYGILYKTTNFIRIPPPGITTATISRAKNGVLAMATLEISVPSLVQLESLHRTFLVPGVGMILEWGQQFAAELKPSLGELSDISANLFPWYNRTKLLEILNKLATNQLGLKEILDDYAYASQGQYMWMFGRVANFSTKSNSDGSFNCTVKIVGPSEDSFAYSTQNTIIPSKDSSTAYFCASDTTSVSSYFTETVPGGVNFKTLLDNTLAGGPWQQHVQILSGGNKKAGEPTSTEQNPVISQNNFADAEDAYFITWRFFVNRVLNSTDKNYAGLKYLFSTVMSDKELEKVGLLLPYATGDDRKNTTVDKLQYINDPMESYVGMNKFLRSIDPSTLIIVNEKAAQLAQANPQYNIPTSEVKFFEPNEETKKFYASSNKNDPRGLFEESTTADEIAEDRGFLSSGVWLNHKAVAECMLGSTTVIRGIVSLLERMNNATLNYWKLAIDYAEPMKGSEHSFNYMVVDANFRESSDRAVSKFIDKVHTFNKYVRTDTVTGKLIGSELTECSIDLSLPKRLFTQIATLGLVQPEDMQKIAAIGKTKDELAEEAAAAEKPGVGPNKPPKISDPNDTLREMFAITSLAGGSKGNFDDNLQGPDITILPKTARAAQLKASGVCGKANTQTTANTAGVGQKPGPIDPSANLSDKNTAELKKTQEDAKKTLETDICKKCETCPPPKAPPVTTQPTNKKLSQLTVSEVLSVQKPAGTVLAVGKYQAIPATFKAWIAAQKIPTDTVFDSAAQEKLGDYLIVGKRPKVGRFVNGDTSITIEDAQLELAKEFASIPVPYKVTRPAGAASKSDPGAVLEAGQSYYYGIAGNKSTASSAKYQEALRIARQNKSLQSLKEFIAKGEGNYDALNRGIAGDTKLDSTEYYAALNQRKSSTSSTKVCSDEAYIEIGTIGLGNLNTFGFADNTAFIKEGKARCAKCATAKLVTTQTAVVIAEKEKATQAAEKAIRDFPGMNRIFRYVEIFPENMVAEITDSANGQFSNAFGASPAALSISGDIAMPGIAGLRVGELFWIDRIPTFYKAFGAFQIMGVEDIIGRDGWSTKIHSRFNYLGTNWKTAMATKLNSAKAAQAPSTTAPRST
jgi:hypothetical protein